MDVAFNQHSSYARRKNRSTATLNQLSLAPLTPKLPLGDQDYFTDLASAPSYHSTSYLEGKSAPTTPRLLSRSQGPHQRHPSIPTTGLLKSKSATHLPSSHNRKSKSDAGLSAVSQRRGDHTLSSGRTDADWLFRAGAVISSETRESKGQSWLVSRASSTSLTGLRDTEEMALERELARERERELASRRASRRGSIVQQDDDQSLLSSPALSRLGSRSQSRADSRTQLESPFERRSTDEYFPQQDGSITGPDFINLDEELEVAELDANHEDEAYVRRLVKRGNLGVSGWFGNVFGWGLFSVEENGEESDDDREKAEADPEELSEELRKPSVHRLESLMTAQEAIPPPKPDEGGWQDAAWLLSVASKVLL
ncbi:hypothetical protein VTK73DRAFT_6 [Phialemonium thermophilum]|uniref:DUF3984 domain-containing protein n=1 Tax=Phialemonium thermophilum TaxID=223376 RepID=A0ABR3Y7P8_9PEZI